MSFLYDWFQKELEDVPIRVTGTIGEIRSMADEAIRDHQFKEWRNRVNRIAKSPKSISEMIERGEIWIDENGKEITDFNQWYFICFKRKQAEFDLWMEKGKIERYRHLKEQLDAGNFNRYEEIAACAEMEDLEYEIRQYADMIDREVMEAIFDVS